MLVLSEFTIDLSHKDFTQYVYALQNDSNTRGVKISLTNNKNPWTIPQGVTGAVSFKKPDKKGGLYDVLPDGATKAVTFTENVITAIFAPEVLTAKGDIDVSVILYDSDLNRLGTFPFVVRASEDPSGGQSISNNYYYFTTLHAVNNAIGNLNDLKTLSKDNLVKAINELITLSGGVITDEQVQTAVTNYFTDNPILIDSTLKNEGEAADAKATGDALNALSKRMTSPIVCAAVGDVVSVHDSDEQLLQGLYILGKTKQLKTTGKNLLENTCATATINGVTFVVNSDGSIHAHGTASEDVYIKIGSADLDSGTSYILNGCPSGGSTSTYMLYCASNAVYDIGNGATFAADGSEYAVWFKVAGGYNLSSVVIKPMLRLATVSDSSYEPYTGGIAAPNPSYPQELTNVGEGRSIAVNVVGKNLLPYPYYYGTTKINGITFTDNGDGSVTANGTATSNATYYLVHHDNPLRLTKGKDYTISGCPAGGGDSAYRLVLQDITYAQGGFDDGSGATLNTKYAEYYAFIRVISGATVNDVTFYPMVEESTVVTKYEPYQVQTLAIPTPNGLPGLPVTSGGNYTDESGQHHWSDYRDCVRGVEGKQIAELVLTGNENWFGNTASYAGWVAAQIATDAMLSTPVLCTHYVGVASGTPAAGQISITSAGSVVIKDAAIGADKAALTAYIAAQYAAGTPVKVRYVLAEPVETPMDDATLAAYAALRTNKPNTTITNDAGAGMKVEYVADTKAYIDNGFAALAAALVNNT